MVIYLKSKVFVFLMSVLITFSFLIAGCINLGQLTKNENETTISSVQNCRMAKEEVPSLEKVCKNITVSTQDCSKRELKYATSAVKEYDICMSGDGCAGKNLSECLYLCDRANKRCVLEITNNDNIPGVWTVGATITQGKSVFVKEPQTKRIEPGQKVSFEFIQIYNIPDNKPTTTNCAITIVSPAYIEECKTITTVKEECEDKKVIKIVEREVCD
mgnify:CR=1 FL=1